MPDLESAHDLGHLAPCDWEPVVISLNCLLLNMNSINETLLFDRLLIMYDLCIFTCIIFIFVFHCTHVRMSYVLNSYLLTYLLRSLIIWIAFCCIVGPISQDAIKMAPSRLLRRAAMVFTVHNRHIEFLYNLLMFIIHVDCEFWANCVQ